jgi:hypothetical protein
VIPSNTTFSNGLGVVPDDSLNTFTQTCQTFAQLRLFVGLVGMAAIVQGGAAPGDGQGGIFYWNAGNYTDNGMTVIVPPAAFGQGAWLAVPQVVVSPLPAGGSVGQPLLNTGSGTGDWGNDIIASAGNNLTLTGGDQGGDVIITGTAGTPVAAGGSITIAAGFDAGGGSGQVAITGGDSVTTGVVGGSVGIEGGDATVGNANGGDVGLSPGSGSGTGRSGKIIIRNATSLPGSATGTLTNAPHSGNADLWVEVEINNTVGWIPWWHA